MKREVWLTSLSYSRVENKVISYAPVLRCCIQGVLACFIASGAALALASNGIELIGQSMQARARGGADVAIGDSALSQLENPACLSFSGMRELDFSGQALFPIVDWYTPIDHDRSEVRVLPLANVGFSRPEAGGWAWGVALQSKSGLGSRYEVRHLGIPWMERQVGSDFKDVAIALNAAKRVGERLTLGAGIRIEAATAEFETILGPLGVTFGRGWSFGGGFQAGLHYRITPELAVGAAYRSPTWLTDMRGGSARASFFGLPDVHLGAARLDDPILPQRVALGTAWDVTQRLKLVGEARWINSKGGSLNGFTIATDTIRLPIPLGYRDQWILIAGAELKLSSRLTLGIGYNYASKVVPRDNLYPIGSVITQHHVTAGLRYEENNWWVGGGYIAALPSSLAGSGRTDIPLGVDFTHSRLEQVQHSVVIGFGLRW